MLTLRFEGCYLFFIHFLLHWLVGWFVYDWINFTETWWEVGQSPLYFVQMWIEGQIFCSELHICTVKAQIALNEMLYLPIMMSSGMSLQNYSYGCG